MSAINVRDVENEKLIRQLNCGETMVVGLIWFLGAKLKLVWFMVELEWGKQLQENTVNILAFLTNYRILNQVS